MQGKVQHPLTTANMFPKQYINSTLNIVPNFINCLVMDMGNISRWRHLVTGKLKVLPEALSSDFSLKKWWTAKN